MRYSYVIVAFAALVFAVSACDEVKPTSDQIQRRQQEQVEAEGSNAVGFPAIHTFREKRLLKDIYEMRDQDGLVTYTYTFSEQTGTYKFFCDSIGYGIPYATQFTNPQKIASSYQGGYAILPQADPNGLFSPASAEGTWVLCKDPHGSKTRPVYIEPRVIVSPFKLD